MAIRGSFYVTEKIGPKRSRTPEGFLLCEEVAVARTGMMIYGPDETPIKAGPDGVVKIFREPADVFRPETVASAQGKSVTNDHPEEDVTPSNWKELTHGTMLNVRRGEGAMDDLLIADLLITTEEGIQAVEADKLEVSLGYEADYEETSPGTGKQTDIVINHVALVEQGRCGPRCAIRDEKPKLEKELTVAKSNKFMDALRRAFKAKDEAELEAINKEVSDEISKGVGSTGAGEGDTHIHIHSDSEVPTVTGDNERGEPAEGGRMRFSDDDLQAHIDQNAQEHSEMMSRIAALEAAIGRQSAEDAESEELQNAIKDEVPEELQKEAAKAKDSAYLGESFQDTVAMAEILVPGIKIPTYDRAAKPGQTFKKICGLRKQALDLAYVRPDTRSILDDLLGGKGLDTKSMTCDAARVLFRSAGAAKRVANNNGNNNRTADALCQSSAQMTLAELNRRNAERYK